jgi:threonine dehydratase
MTTTTTDLITREDIKETAELISPFIRRTPVININARDFGLDDIELSFKLEFMQHTGSFTGVVAASGGNHGAAVAYAAMQRGVPAKIFVPGVISPAKLARMQSYQADLVIVGERYADALAASESWASETGALPVHAFDQRETLLGQATVALEFAEQADLDSLLVAVGGGGLIGGIAAWYRGSVKIVGVEPQAAPTLYQALAAGRPVDAEAGGIAADSLAPRRVGELMFPLAQKFISEAVLVSDDAIEQSQQELWKVLRVVCEPGGAAAFAALLSKKYLPAKGERVGVLLCGGNTVAVNFNN